MDDMHDTYKIINTPVQDPRFQIYRPQAQQTSRMGTWGVLGMAVSHFQPFPPLRAVSLVSEAYKYEI